MTETQDQSDGHTPRRRIGLRWAALLACLALVVSVAAGCGDDDSGSSSTTGGSASTSDSGDATANADVEGKTVAYVDVLGAAAVQKRFFNAFKTAAEHIGWNVEFQDSAGDPAKAIKIMQNLVNGGNVDAIVSSSVPVEWVRPALQAAKEKGIPTANFVTQATPDNYTADINENQEEVTHALSEELKAKYPDGAKVGVLFSALTSIKARLDTLKSDLKGTGIDVVAESDVPLTAVPSAQKLTVDMLNANPDLNVIVGLSDDFSPHALAGIRSAAQGRKVDMYSFYADAVNVPLMQRAGSPLVGVVDSDSAKVGFIAVDEFLKFFSDKPTTPQQFAEISPKVITKDNIPESAQSGDVGPVPFEELGAPYYEQWKEEYGLGN